MTSLGWFFLGAITLGLAEILACVLWYYRMVKDVGQSTHEAVREDLLEIRRGIQKRWKR